jgi:hypothetical protein
MINKSILKERKGKRMYIADDLTKEERETQKKLRELAREERDRGKRVKIGYRKIQISGEWFRWNEIEENFLEEGENKKRRPGEKRYKEKVNKKVKGQIQSKRRERTRESKCNRAGESV